MSDELRNQLRQLDPMHPGVWETSPSRQRLEDIMASTSIDTTRSNRTVWYAGAAAAAVVAVAVAIPALGGETPIPTTVAAVAPLELSLGEGDSMASCIAFDVAFLAEMPLAFEGTVTALEGELVTLTVDRWFKGGEASSVELAAPNGLGALIGSIDFVEGGRFLITATDGAVNYCGFSGAATPELTAAFEEAFGS